MKKAASGESVKRKPPAAFYTTSINKQCIIIQKLAKIFIFYIAIF